MKKKIKEKNLREDIYQKYGSLVVPDWSKMRRVPYSSDKLDELIIEFESLLRETKIKAKIEVWEYIKRAYLIDSDMIPKERIKQLKSELLEL